MEVKQNPPRPSEVQWKETTVLRFESKRSVIGMVIKLTLKTVPNFPCQKIFSLLQTETELNNYFDLPL